MYIQVHTDWSLDKGIAKMLKVNAIIVTTFAALILSDVRVNNTSCCIHFVFVLVLYSKCYCRLIQCIYLKQGKAQTKLYTSQLRPKAAYLLFVLWDGLMQC